LPLDGNAPPGNNRLWPRLSASKGAILGRIPMMSNHCKQACRLFTSPRWG
jgi:hypothetical protein